MENQKTAAIVHYNTPELTEAAIKSLWKSSGRDWQVVIFDNSDERPWKKRMKGVKVINNTKGQVIDWEAFLSDFPNRSEEHAGVNGWGSAKHTRSVQELFRLIPGGFLLMGSDILLRRDINFMWREDRCTVGHVQQPQPGNKFGIGRLVPMLCYINAAECVKRGAVYFDPDRSWMLHGADDRRSWYDTGAAFLEDIRSHRNGLNGTRIDIRPLMVHYQSGSWRRGELAKQAAWLKSHEILWSDEK